ncbi:MAG: T9SS type A sorting domain-containing protein [Bacteroidota bacterium]
MKKSILFFILIFFSFPLCAQNNPPIAVNDSAIITNCDTFMFHPLTNDYDIDGDSFRIFSAGTSHAKWIHKTDSTISLLILPDWFGPDSIKYMIREVPYSGVTVVGWIYLDIQNCHCVDSVNINNINARINNNGNLFWDFIGESKFEVPKGSGKHTIFNSTFWIGGLDSLDTLHVAAEIYEQTGHDFWSGPISNVYDSLYNAKWNHVWEIYKTDIDYHLTHCWQPGYIPAQVLIDWPGNGDTALGQSAITALFKDWNNDGIYNPYGGDYPLIKGDQAIYYIFNDDCLPHTESGGNKLGIEVHGMAYAFDCPDDSALWNTLFINYKIFNRSEMDYYNSFLGIYVDFDNGEWNDDYMGCDVQRGSFYVYNGDDIDGTGNLGDYGKFPPAQSLTVLAGPYMDPDGMDNPAGQCDESTNGFNFGNGIVDDERFGLRRFVYFNNGGTGNQSYPEIADDYYNYLQGKWKDSTKMQWGGNAHAPGPGVCGPECDFMFPADTDPCYWGTAGLTPNCTPYWTETTTGNMPADRRGFGSMGTFTFEAGSMEELDIAFVFGRDYIDSTAQAGVTVMQQRIDSIRNYFLNDSTPCGLGFSGIAPSPIIIPQVKIFPNPAIGYITVEASGMLCDLKYELFDIIGRKINQGKLNCTSANQINVSNLDKGIYILNISDGLKKFSRKLIKN